MIHRWLTHNKITACISFLIIFSLIVPGALISAGYQEEKLFDSTFYTQEDLRKKIEQHDQEVLDYQNQIKSLQTDIDWIVLKINQIQDSGRSVDYKLKNALSTKEKKVAILSKSQKRLEYLVQYYTSMLAPSPEKDLDEIVRGKIPALSLNRKGANAAGLPLQTDNSASLSKNFKEVVNGSAIEPLSPYPLQDDLVAMRSKDGNTRYDLSSGDIDKYDSVSGAELEIAVAKEGLSDWVQVISTGSCVRLETTLPILFPSGSAALSEEYKEFLKKFAGFLKPYDVKIMVTGYADKMPIKNEEYPSNFELGATRAANIVHQLVGYGLKPSIFKIESTGKHRFASKQPFQQNSLERRAEVTVIFSG